MESDFADCRFETIEHQEKKHGREDHYAYYQFAVPPLLPGRQAWKKLTTIGVAIRCSQRGAQTSEDVRYYISSLPLDVKLFAKTVRGHWAIENTLHWCLDVTFREDDCRIRERHLTGKHCMV